MNIICDSHVGKTKLKKKTNKNYTESFVNRNGISHILQRRKVQQLKPNLQKKKTISENKTIQKMMSKTQR